MGYTDINAETIDRWVENGWEWGVPISQEQFRAAVSGDWQMLLTPVKPVPREWFPPLRGDKGAWGWPPAADSRCPYSRHRALNVQCWTILSGSWKANAWWQRARDTRSKLSAPI